MCTHGMVPYHSAAGTFIAQDWEMARHVVAGERLERLMEPTECREGVFSIGRDAGRNWWWIGLRSRR